MGRRVRGDDHWEHIRTQKNGGPFDPPQQVMQNVYVIETQVPLARQRP